MWGLLLRNFSLFSKYVKTSNKPVSLTYSQRLSSLSQSESIKTLKTTVLPNGFTVITESPSFPSRVTIGLLHSFGTRNESANISGALQMLKNCFLFPSEQENYVKLQLLGASLSMDFDYENTFYSGHCQVEDTKNFLKILLEITKKKKKISDQNIINQRHKDFWDSREEIRANRICKEMWIENCFSGSLCNKLSGEKDRVISLENLNFCNEMLQNSKCVLVASGIEEHDEFVEILKELEFGRIGGMEEKLMGKSEFLEKDLRICCDSEMVYAFLSFPGCALGEKDFLALDVLAHAFATDFSTKEKKKIFLFGNTEVKALNFSFTDTGVFALHAVVPIPFANSVIETFCKHLLELKSMTPNDLSVIKRNYKLDLLKVLESPQKRLENIGKVYLTNQTLFNLQSLINQIDDLTLENLNTSLTNLLNSPSNLLYLAKNTASFPPLFHISNTFKSL